MTMTDLLLQWAEREPTRLRRDPQSASTIRICTRNTDFIIDPTAEPDGLILATVRHAVEEVLQARDWHFKIEHYPHQSENARYEAIVSAIIPARGGNVIMGFTGRSSDSATALLCAYLNGTRGQTAPYELQIA